LCHLGYHKRPIIESWQDCFSHVLFLGGDPPRQLVCAAICHKEAKIRERDRISLGTNRKVKLKFEAVVA
jgi:hypothetical protein